MAYSQLNNGPSQQLPQQIYGSSYSSQDLQGNDQYVSLHSSETSPQGSSNPQQQDPPSHIYTSWSSNVPVSKVKIEEIFNNLKEKFGFQRDNTRNMFDHLMCMLDSRASRMNPYQALITLHADYIGGVNANYRKWYFASGINVYSKNGPQDQDQWDERMNAMSENPEIIIRQLALWLLLWGEASLVRFMSECLCFIFKLADDYDKSPKVQPVFEGDYLHNVITPLYNYILDQCYEIKLGKFVKRKKDHSETIGYDDINQLFWYRKTISNIVFQDEEESCIKSIMDSSHSQRYLKLRHVKWKHVFNKTYKEKRTWLHLAVNFTRIWIIEISACWYFTVYNSPFLYSNNKVEPAVQWSILAIGGAISTLLMIIGRICELFFNPLRNNLIFIQFLLLFIVFIINSTPFYYVIVKVPPSLIIGMSQFFISLITSFTFAIVPKSHLFGSQSKDEALHVFTANYARLNYKDRLISIGLWCCIFGCKLVESYFLSLVFKDFLKAMLEMRIIGSIICSLVLALAIVIMFLLYLILLFSSTYLWYVIWNVIFSVTVHALTLGRSIWIPRQINFTMLSKHIRTKILPQNSMDVNDVSQIWNAIVISMYNEHLLSIENVKNLFYQQENDKGSWNSPTIFVSHNDDQYGYPPMSEEAKRRITFFSQSLSNNIQDPLPIHKTPTFTVFTPHYSEKILLSLDEIGENDQNTRVNLLEYLKQLHPIEWENFEQGNNLRTCDSIHVQEYLKEQDNFTEDDNNLSKRMWVSRRTQTLFRTISGFMNYSKAIKLLYRVENPDIIASCANDPEKLENELASMARRKFKFLISMQRYNEFDEDEQKNVDFLLRAYPDLQIAYLDQVRENEGDKPKFFSVLIDGHCELLSNGKRKPRYRIQLPGNPILGDGKSDNQNHAIIFYRGEYLQLVDANQDNYLEECLKISNILGEFEQYNISEEPTSEYEKESSNTELEEVKVNISPYLSATKQTKKNPIAIIGACEYIFSKNYGVLGDIIAGKGQAFGTLTQRTLAKVGGRLHYGHPDFLNAIFMTTRGGISKGQKGLHLSEDIYAGINSFIRGGHIKQCDYIQCGKGRDLGFESILHFTTKTSMGMGEQILSREYYYLGTQLALDRLLTFYYAHPGFHLNHIFIKLSVQLFMYGMMFIGAMRTVFSACSALQNVFCYNFIPITDWIKWSIILIIFASFIDFLPLFSQEFVEKGFIHGVIRLCKHFISLSPFFEVFNSQIYANSIMTNLNYGGAHYISSGRGFTTAHIPFFFLYLRFSRPSIYFGMRILLILLFISLTIWIPYLGYFWFLVISLCISPFLFNLHQFSFIEFISDYHEFLIWMYSETHANSWINHCHASMTMITNYKLGYPSEKLVKEVSNSNFTIIFKEIILSFILAVFCIIVYVFVKSFDLVILELPNAKLSIIISICFIAIGPILMNAIVLSGFYFILFCFKFIFNQWFDKFKAVINIIMHTFAVINLIGVFEFLWIMESQNPVNAILSIIVLIAILRFVIKVLIIWYGKKFGLLSIIQPFYNKIIEMILFAKDFILGHILLFMLMPIFLIPWIDKWHFTMLFWLKPNKKVKIPIFLQKKKYNIWIYGLLFIMIFIIFIGLIVSPLIINNS
ncbi:Glycosyltransferase Family 48 protein [Glomus cerebriforme]|uniref:1,3-beta-glucan synthase n=1 Tax=Glomus cerebriforme TaxID=658196 RepID=A0A397SX69_9GLOM|nr:Glycosyltransferase Family 48 protein [Glomus cerebriforme]